MHPEKKAVNMENKQTNKKGNSQLKINLKWIKTETASSGIDVRTCWKRIRMWGNVQVNKSVT